MLNSATAELSLRHVAQVGVQNQNRTSLLAKIVPSNCSPPINVAVNANSSGILYDVELAASAEVWSENEFSEGWFIWSEVPPGDASTGATVVPTGLTSGDSGPPGEQAVTRRARHSVATLISTVGRFTY